MQLSKPACCQVCGFSFLSLNQFAFVFALVPPRCSCEVKLFSTDTLNVMCTFSPDCLSLEVSGLAW